MTVYLSECLLPSHYNNSSRTHVNYFYKFEHKVMCDNEPSTSASSIKEDASSSKLNDVSMEDDDDGEYEEKTFVMTLGGIFDPNMVNQETL